MDFLMRPTIRYRYLLRLRPLIAFDRKEEVLSTCLEYVATAGVHGDYLEFGLWKGANLIRAYYLAQQFKTLSDMRFFGFDSFEGIPELDDPSENELFPVGMFTGTYDEVVANLKRAALDMRKVSLTQGWFSHSLTATRRDQLGVKSAAIVFVDCDVFESTVPVLEFIEPILADGAVVVFDDWYSFKNKEDFGEQKAFAEWLARNRHFKAAPYKDVGWGGKAFIVNRTVPNRSSGDLRARSLATQFVG
jgi:O-methyltransferase